MQEVFDFSENSKIYRNLPELPTLCSNGKDNKPFILAIKTTASKKKIGYLTEDSYITQLKGINMVKLPEEEENAQEIKEKLGAEKLKSSVLAPIPRPKIFQRWEAFSERLLQRRKILMQNKKKQCV
eukprot:TRINITY_DN1551_c0_g1_i4.p2 TRINITY_DN1551_c0_g1~~TRINITY_DN1551_c0_g1_i4.p2  ORF type:complete len:126 (+),score=19.21 TRINITY_DN1551_c0_g1_i4:240-617(+)